MDSDEGELSLNIAPVEPPTVTKQCAVDSMLLNLTEHQRKEIERKSAKLAKLMSANQPRKLLEVSKPKYYNGGTGSE